MDVAMVRIYSATLAPLAPPGGEPPNRIKKQLLAEVHEQRGQASSTALAVVLVVTLVVVSVFILVLVLLVVVVA